MSRNDQGVPISFITLSIEPNGFDSSVRSFGTSNGFDYSGLDLVVDDGNRTNIRSGFSHFSGEPAERTPSQVNINDRRRFVILNGQPGPNQWEVLYISNDFSNRDADTVREIIDSVTAPGSDPVIDLSTLDSDEDGLNDAFEIANQLDPNDAADAEIDSDQDGFTNREEFLAGTLPNDPTSRLAITTVLASSTEIGLRWESVVGVRYQVETSDNLASPDWIALTTVVADAEMTETVHDRDEGQFYRVRVPGDTAQ